MHPGIRQQCVVVVSKYVLYTLILSIYFKVVKVSACWVTYPIHRLFVFQRSLPVILVSKSNVTFRGILNCKKVVCTTNATIFQGDLTDISAQTKALVSLLTVSPKFDSFFQMLKIRCPGSSWLVGLYSSEAFPGILHGHDVK